MIALHAALLMALSVTSHCAVRKPSHTRRLYYRFFSIESIVLEQERRRELLDLHMSILDRRESIGDVDAVVKMTGCYHNLLRIWADA
jgi:predicted 2-oxoglutarate/Fe(II)-dependent dioxygenase YbiX